MALDLPVPGGDAGTWDEKLNAALTQLDMEKLTASTASATYPSAFVLTGPGIDPTGAADSSTAMQARLNEARDSLFTKAVFVPAGTFLHNAALVMPSNVKLFGSGPASVFKSTALASGGTGIGHRQIDCSGSSGWQIHDVTLDAGQMTFFPSGMRSVLATGCTDYEVRGVTFRTPGAAIASLNSSHYRIVDNDIEVVSADGLAHHDGLIDQWDGSHDFLVRGNTLRGNGIGKFGILVTGADTASVVGRACYNFKISENTVLDFTQLGIWSNGRLGVNHDFAIFGNVVRNITQFHGIGISDSDRWTCDSNLVDGAGRNGLSFNREGTLGATAAIGGTVMGNVVRNANTVGTTSTTDGAAIFVGAESTDLSLIGNRVAGTTHTYAISFDAATSNNEVVGSNYEPGTLGTISNPVASNRIPGGGVYSPTLTAVANVASTISRQCRWSRQGNVVTVTGRLDITPTAAASTSTTVGISLPIPSNFADNATDAAGVGNSEFGLVGAIRADTVNDRAQLQFPSPNTASNAVFFTFQYTVR